MLRVRPLALLALAIATSPTWAWGRGAVAMALEPSDQTLEIAPRMPPPAATAPTPDLPAGAAVPSPGDTGLPQPAAGAASTARPYLGIAVQTIYANDRPNGLVNGLEVVSVDPGSPAAAAGLLGRTKMTSVGETGATASSLIAPLNLFVMPLLKKSGSLGRGGDLIVAIDDHRVTNDFDLEAELSSLKPGDLIYLTIVRAQADGSQKTLKVPIKLGDSTRAAQAANADDAVPLANRPQH